MLLLERYPEGKSEYDYFTLLQTEPFAVFRHDALSEPLRLFQSHFILFHALYQLRAQFRSEQSFDIVISATSIKKVPLQIGDGELDHIDELQSYYLDWQNFAQTEQKDVEALLDDFWSKMSGGDAHSFSKTEISAAYQAFDLPYNSDLKLVKARYYHQLHSHHPDKGGEHIKAQFFEHHYRLLKSYLKHS